MWGLVGCMELDLPVSIAWFEMSYGELYPWICVTSYQIPRFHYDLGDFELYRWGCPQ